MTGLSEEYLSHLANLIDSAAGRISIPFVAIGSTVGYRPRLLITLPVRAPLDEIVASLGVGAVTVRTTKSGRLSYRYRVVGTTAVQVLLRVQPYLRVKQSRVDDLVRFQNRDGGVEREA